MKCLLCDEQRVAPLGSYPDKVLGDRSYFKCPACELVFLDPQLRLDKTSEKTRYDLHRNSLDDPDYLAFLSRLADPFADRLEPNAAGLDYGCGPVPAMASLMKNKGFEVASFDPFYFPQEELLTRPYDFICCSEAVEHFYDPQKEFDTMFRCLKPKGLIGIMTNLLTAQIQFESWWYRKDPTHVCFYNYRTFEWVARRYKLGLEVFDDRIVLLKAD